jgi:hypothetical protein
MKTKRLVRLVRMVKCEYDGMLYKNGFTFALSLSCVRANDALLLYCVFIAGDSRTTAAAEKDEMQRCHLSLSFSLLFDTRECSVLH